MMKIDIVMFDLPEQKVVSGNESFVELADDALRVAYKGLFSELDDDTKIWEEKNRSYEFVCKKEIVVGATMHRVIKQQMTYWKICFLAQGIEETYVMVRKYSEAKVLYDKVLDWIFNVKSPLANP